MNLFNFEKKIEDLKVKIKVLDGGRFPTKGTEFSGCYDLYAREVEITRGHIKYYLGIMTELPKGYDAIIIPRGSVYKSKLMLSNSIGYIDNDYRGEWAVIFKSRDLSDGSFYQVGDRCCQFRLMETIPFSFEETDVLNETKRADKGFGSTGI
jgi:dUTP pyrophosphatase